MLSNYPGPTKKTDLEIESFPKPWMRTSPSAGAAIPNTVNDQLATQIADQVQQIAAANQAAQAALQAAQQARQVAAPQRGAGSSSVRSYLNQKGKT